MDDRIFKICLEQNPHNFFVIKSAKFLFVCVLQSIQTMFTIEIKDGRESPETPGILY